MSTQPNRPTATPHTLCSRTFIVDLSSGPRTYRVSVYRTPRGRFEVTHTSKLQRANGAVRDIAIASVLAEYPEPS